MSIQQKTHVFVFKKEDRLESDRVFSVFSKDFGRIEIFGKAIRKMPSKLRGNTEIFSFSKFEFIQGKSKKTLTDAIFIEKFKTLKEIPEKLETAYKIADVVDDFIKGEEPDEHIYNLLKDVFNKLDICIELSSYYQLIYYYFIWNFIFILGYGPELFMCAICKKSLNPLSLYFSNKEGGAICEQCSLSSKDNIKVKADVIKVIRLILKKDWTTLLKLKIALDCKNELEQVSENYYKYLLSSHSLQKNI